MDVPMASNKYLTKNVKMNHNEEVPDFLGGLGDMLPANVLKMLNELLEQQHRKDKNHQGSTVFIYAPGSQYVDKQFNIGAYPRPLPKGKGVENPGSCAFESRALVSIETNLKNLKHKTMETTEEQTVGRGGISNFYYGSVTNVINLKLTKEQVEVLGSGNNIAETINSMINPNTEHDHGK